MTVTPRGKAGIHETIRLVITIVAAIAASFGYMYIEGPNQIISRVDPRLLEQKARPYAFTKIDNEANLRAQKELENRIRMLESLMEKFLLTGPQIVRENQDDILDLLREMAKAQNEHFQTQRTQREERWYPTPGTWGRR